MPKVEINAGYCKGCRLCIRACPKKVLDIGDETNAMGYHVVAVVDADKCIGCAFCAISCPDAAITVFK